MFVLCTVEKAKQNSVCNKALYVLSLGGVLLRGHPVETAVQSIDTRGDLSLVPLLTCHSLRDTSLFKATFSFAPGNIRLFGGACLTLKTEEASSALSYL